MTEFLAHLKDKISFLQESSLEANGKHICWQVTAFDQSGVPVGSGLSTDKKNAIKIAISEFIERSFVHQLKSSKTGAIEWKLDEFPTSCGFAAGFNLRNTKLRSIAEGLERWALSNWFDYDCPLQEIQLIHATKESIITNELSKEFAHIRCFTKDFAVLFEQQLINLYLVMTIGFSSTGAFFGSAVRASRVEAIDHALTESHRHLLISRQTRDFNKFPFNRILYFSNNREKAESILNKTRTNVWPVPQVLFQKAHQESFAIVRTIFEGWTPWNHGSLGRPLY